MKSSFMTIFLLFNHTRPWTAGRAARKGDGTALKDGAHPQGRNTVEEPERRPGLRTDRAVPQPCADCHAVRRSEEHTSELQSLMRISYAVFCLKKKTKNVQRIHKEISEQ